MLGLTSGRHNQGESVKECGVYEHRAPRRFNLFTREEQTLRRGRHALCAAAACGSPGKGASARDFRFCAAVSSGENNG